MTRARRRDGQGQGWWVGTGLLAVAVIAAIAVAVAVTLGSGAHRPAAAPRPSPTGTWSAAPATTSGQKWLTGRAGRLLGAINADLGHLTAAKRARHHAAVKRAAARLAAAARAALRGPMPRGQARAYRSALRDFARAGAEITAGHLFSAAALLASANAGITRVTAAADRPARAMTTRSTSRARRTWVPGC